MMEHLFKHFLINTMTYLMSIYTDKGALCAGLFYKQTSSPGDSVFSRFGEKRDFHFSGFWHLLDNNNMFLFCFFTPKIS